MLMIEMYYEENLNLGNYQTLRVGLKVKSDKAIGSPEELEAHSSKLLELAKENVQAKLEEIKQERGIKQ